MPLEERAIGGNYATLVPEIVAIFEWAHMLHRQIYDVLANDRIWPADRDARVAEVLNRKRPLSLEMIRRLHTGLGIGAEILIQPYPLAVPAPNKGI